MTVKSLRNKILVILILFTLLFTNCGFTIQAIATSDEFRVIAKGLFQKDEMKFKAYFVDSEGKETSEIINDVSKPANLVLEITPQVEGVLKSGLIRLVPFEEGELNFRLTGSVEDQVEKLKSTLNEQAEKEEVEDTTEENVEAETEVTEKVESPSVESTEAEEKTDSEVSTNSMLEEIGSALKSAITKNTETEKDENQEESSTSSLKSVLNKKDQTEETETAEETEEIKETEKEEIVDSEKVEEIEEKEADGEEVVETTEPEIEEEFVDEEALAEAKLQEAKLREELENAISDIKVISDNEIQLSYIKEKTKIELEIEYVQGEKLSVKDLMQKFKLQFSGSFINEDLKEIEIGKEEELTVGWKYSKDFTLSSEYSKVSPFEVGEVTGTIIENRIVVSRKEEGKFLPAKSLNIEITVPTLEGEKPTNIEVNAIKLMATRGEDIGFVNFNSENWTYDEESGKIIITVNNLDENGYAINSVGEDEFVVTYRYEKYIEEEPNLLKRVKASLEEYSSPENNILTKEISNKQQEIKIDAGEIVTYNVTTSDDKINKAKIYANYNSDEAVYETEFKTQVSVNILTSDVLETLKIDCSKDTYKDIENTMFDARDIKVKQIKFNYSEIISLLENGGDITIMNKNGETLNILRRELITSEDDVILNLNNSEGLIVAVNNIKSNGIMNFEVTKVILKSSYDKSAYKNFKELESITSAEIKYTELEETVELEETKVSKKFEEAMTIANIVLNKETLSTIKSNEDVELKIELNNDKEYSDLYVNPSFEIVFPKYVKEVSVQSVNILYEEGLRVDDFKTYKEDDIVKIKLDLKGTQTKFVDSEFTNGTNIILNLNIEVDDYTPAKEDQIKLYYCNEGVTSYQTQTKWSIGKAIPNGILKTSNGFDVALINYQAPTGLVTANGIINYDGKLSEVTSVRQGPETRQINRNEPARIATMELLALNNTGNDCTDVLLLGRVPFKGNEDVVSHDDMGTTVSTKMLDELKANIENKNLTKIYYSTYEDAIADLSDEQSGWTETPERLSDVKSFLIEVKGTMEPGTALIFTYDFEIPANLPYDTYIAGSFGAFYYNKTDVAVVYESSTADKVSLFTEAGPRLEARLSVDIGDGATIQSYKYLTYTISVVNSGSITAENIYIKAPIPQFTQYVSKQDIAQGDAGYLVEPDTELNFDVGTIYPGEVKEYTYTVRALKDTSSVNTPEEINERSKIKNKIEVTSSLFASSIESNEVVNYITNTVFKTETRTDTIETVTVGQKNTYSIVFENVSEKELNKVKVALVVGDLYQYESATLDGKAAKAKFDEKEGKIIVEVGKLNVNEFKELVVEVVGKNSDVGSERDCYFELSAEGVDAERSVAFHRMIAKSYLVAEDASENIPKQLNEEDKIVVVTKITNNGTVSTTSTLLEITLPDRMAVDSINYNNEYSLGYKRKDGKVNIDLPLTSPDDTVYVTITFIAQNAEGSDDEIVQIVRKVRNENQVDIELNPIEIVVINDKLTLREAAMAEQQAIIDKNTKEAENENKTEEKQEQPNESIPETNNTPQESVVSEPEPRTEEPQEEIRPNEEERNESTPITETNQEETTRSEEQTEAANTAETNKTIDNSSSGTVEDEHHEDHDDHEDHKHNYVISGKAWYDINNNGILDDEEAGVKEVKVYLYNTSNEMVKSTITNHDGTYNFEVEEEKYFIGFKYDESKYQLTPYNKNESEEDRTSKAISVTSDTIDAMTNSMQVGSNIENVNIGLQDKNRFDITINKYISKAIVTTSKNEKTHEFPNLDLTKIEINRKLIDGAKVDLEYVIVIENTGNIEGYAQQVVDYIEPGIEFNEEENKDWYLGTDGNIYTKNLNDELLKPGDKKELRILLHKQMTNDNTGFVLNKVNLLSTFAQENIEENEEGNTSVQTTFIAVSTGRTRQTATYIVMTFVIAAAIYIYMKEFAKSNKTIYKTDTKPKIKNSGKKIYK